MNKIPPMTTRKRRVGRKRWGDLIRFLTMTMQSSKSERVQMQAAQRLADILILREQREQLEMRRELRQAGAGDEPDDTPEPAQETPEQAADRLIASVRKGSNSQ